MKSKLEEYTDKFLFRISKIISQSLTNEGYELSKNLKMNDQLFGNVDQMLKTLSLNNGYDDIEFIFELIKKNIELLSEEKLSSKLIRPKMNKFSFDVDISETVYQTTTYKHKILSYSDNPIDIIRIKEGNADFAYTDGVSTDVHIGDVDIDEIKIDLQSFKKID